MNNEVNINSNNPNNSNDLIEKIKAEAFRWQLLKDEIKKEVVGQDNIVTKLFIALLCNGNLILEGAPGLAKTTLIKALSKGLGLNFGRIQFTPDLLPADLIGTLIYNQKTQEFETKHGPIFTNLVLADEINRAPAKVQSALLEAMQERQVTIGENTFKLDKPFLVLATQNPIEQEGTYRLPEAQLDRFLFKLIVGYPTQSEESEILSKVFNSGHVETVLSKDDLETAQKMVSDIYVDPKVNEYIIKIIFETRDANNEFIEHGASPRGTIALYHAAKAHAFLKKRHFVIPDDVKAVVYDVLRHRILLTYEAEAEGVSSSDVIRSILEKTPSP